MKDRLLFEQRKNSIRDMIYDPNYIPLKLKEMAYLMDVPHKDRGALKEVIPPEASISNRRIRM